MVVKCVYCGNARGKESVTFHKFPLQKNNVLEQWVKNINLGAAFTPTKSMRLCSDHFTNDRFYKVTNAVLLLDDSIPTIFNQYKSQCVYCKKMKNDNEKRTFHKFPLKNIDLLNQWLQCIDLSNFTLTERSLLCSDHFEDKSYYYKQNGKTLKKTAIPTKLTRLDIIDTPTIYPKKERNTSQIGTKIASTDCVVIPNTHHENKKRKICNHNNSTIKLQKRLIVAHQTIQYLKKKLRTRQQQIHQMNKRILSVKEIAKTGIGFSKWPYFFESNG